MIVDEADVLCRSQNGDEAAFALLMREYQSYAFALALRLLCHEEDALDVVQNAFVRVWKHLPAYDGRGKFTTWLYTIVTNLCLDRMRQRKREQRVIDSSSSDTTEFPAQDDMEQRHCNADLIRRLILLTGRLTETQRLVFTLRDLQELSIKEVADITGLSKASVKVHSSQARKRLRQILTTEELLETE